MVRIRLKRIGSRSRTSLLPHRHRRRNATPPPEDTSSRSVSTTPTFPILRQIDFDEEKTELDWLRKGAQPSESVERMLKSKGILDKVKVNA